MVWAWSAVESAAYENVAEQPWFPGGRFLPSPHDGSEQDMRFMIHEMRQLPPDRASKVYSALISALLEEGARIKSHDPPRWIVAVHGGGPATPEYFKTGKKRLEFHVIPDDEGPRVFAEAQATLLGNGAVLAREEEAKKNWGSLLNDLITSTDRHLSTGTRSLAALSVKPSSRQSSRQMMQRGLLVLVLAGVFTACRLEDLRGATVKEAFEIIPQAVIGSVFAVAGLISLVAGILRRMRLDAVQSRHRRLIRLVDRMRWTNPALRPPSS